MPLRTISESKIQRLEILSPDGTVDKALEPSIPDAKLLDLYRKMVEIRVFDERAFNLQRQGRLGTYPQILGQEATQIGPPSCLDPKDWLIPSYRGHGTYYVRGMKLRHTLFYWGGDDRGNIFPPGVNNLPFVIPVGTHLTHAAGIAWAMKLRKEPTIAMTYLGDGTSSKGDFHEALTFVGRFKVPAVYIIDNNHWAISVPRESQAASETLAQKAWGYGLFGLQADGNDILAVYKATMEAVERARRGEPTLLEFETYRMGHHTTADDATRYRSPQELESWKKKDPIARFQKYLLNKGLWNEALEAEILAQAQAMVQEEVAAYENAPPPNPLNMFSNNYSTATWPLVEQRKELEELLALKKDRHETEEFPPAEGRFP